MPRSRMPPRLRAPSRTTRAPTPDRRSACRGSRGSRISRRGGRPFTRGEQTLDVCGFVVVDRSGPDCAVLIEVEEAVELPRVVVAMPHGYLRGCEIARHGVRGAPSD